MPTLYSFISDNFKQIFCPSPNVLYNGQSTHSQVFISLFWHNAILFSNSFNNSSFILVYLFLICYNHYSIISGDCQLYKLHKFSPAFLLNITIYVNSARIDQERAAKKVEISLYLIYYNHYSIRLIICQALFYILFLVLPFLLNTK